MLDKLKSMFNKETLDISFDNITYFLSEYRDRSQKEKIDIAKEIVEAEIKKLSAIISGLSELKASDNYVNVLKDRFCEKALKSMGDLPKDYTLFISYVSSSMSEISGISMKEFRHLQQFRQEMAKIASQIKLTEDKLSDMAKLFESSREKKIGEISLLAEGMKKKKDDIARLDKELSELEKAIPFIKDAAEKEERQSMEILNKLMSLESDVRERILSMEAERGIIKQRIGTEFGAIDKLLKKEQHDNPQKYRRLGDYIQNSADAFIGDGELEIRTILEDIRPRAKKEDPDKYEKILDLLRNIDFFDSMRAQYIGLGRQISAIVDEANAEIMPLEKEKSHVFSSLGENKTEITQLLERRRLKSEEKDRLHSQQDADKALLKKQLEDLTQREVNLID